MLAHNLCRVRLQPTRLSFLSRIVIDLDKSASLVQAFICFHFQPKTAIFLSASLMTTLLLKEMGVKKIVVKALDPIHGKMLQKIGADKIIYSEKEMGVRVAHNLISPGIVDYIEMENNITILSIHVPQEWVNKSLIDTDVRRKYNITVVAIKRGGDMFVNPRPDMNMKEQDMLIILGDSESVKRVTESLEQ